MSLKQSSARLSVSHYIVQAAFLLATGYAALAAAESPSSSAIPFSSIRYKFSLNYPGTFSLIASAHSNAPLVLRDKRGLYPSFNVVVEPGSNFNPELSLSELSKRVVADYNRVGLSNAILVGQSSPTVSGQRAYRFDLTYTMQDKGHRAAVILLPRREFLYVLTFIDTAAGFDSSQALLDALLRSFNTSTEAVEVPERPDETGSSNDDLLFYLLLAGLCGLTLLSAFALRMRRRINPH